jgi:hypothetical protein
MAAPDPRPLYCEMTILGPRLAAVDRLARRQLESKRQGRAVQLRTVPPRFGELLDLAGLAEVLGVEMGRETEQGEERLGLEEERHPGDPPV